MLRLNLEKTGRFLVREQNCGNEAISTAKEFKPELIFLDLIMPDVSGEKLAAQIKAEPALQGIPIVYLSASAAAKEAGSDAVRASEFLLKPVSFQQVMEVLSRYLS